MSGTKGTAAAAGLGPGTPYGEAARVVLSRRLRAVRDSLARLRSAARAGVIDPEEVHQVRVGVRRAAAALRVFSPCIGDERALSKVRGRLKRIRRSIGAARSCDVSMAILAIDRKASDGETRAEIERLENTLRKRRKRSISELRQSLEGYTKKRLNRWRRRLIESIVAPAGFNSLSDAAGPGLAEMLSTVRTLGSADLAGVESLHEMRLEVKRLRYSTEVFGACFESGSLDEASRLLADVQDRLGSANDLGDILKLLDERIADRGANRVILAVREDYSRRLEQACSDFASWWRSRGDAALAGVFQLMLGSIGSHAAAARAESGSDWSSEDFPTITPGVNGSRM